MITANISRIRVNTTIRVFEWREFVEKMAKLAPRSDVAACLKTISKQF
jgi:hypothetical protein